MHPRAAINSANASRQADHFWSAERVAVLCREAREGHSASSIATTIGDGCTRCMVIGKARRLGVTVNGWARHREHLAQQKTKTQADRIRSQIAALQAKLEAVEPKEAIRVSHETSGAAP